LVPATSEVESPRVRLAILSLLLHATGCSFDLDPRPSRDLLPDTADLAPRDSVPALEQQPDRALQDQGCEMKTTTILADGDAALLSGVSASTLTGAYTIGNIGSAIQSVGIVHFPVASLPAGLRVIRVAFTPAANDDHCSNACGSCDSIQKAGSFDLRPLVSDWTESEVSWNEKAKKIPWGAPGAMGLADRGSLLTSASFEPGSDLVFEVATTAALIEAKKWMASGQLSFHIAPHEGAVIVAAMREQAGANCLPHHPAPRLELVYCP